MLVTFDQIYCVLTLLTFSKITTPWILIKLLSNRDKYILSKKNWKKSGGYGAQISETGVFVNHTFNIWGEFSMCQTLTSTKVI